MKAGIFPLRAEKIGHIRPAASSPGGAGSPKHGRGLGYARAQAWVNNMLTYKDLKIL